MADFNLDMWMKRIQRRKLADLSKATTDPLERKRIYSRYYRDIEAAVGIDRLIDWSKKNSLKVEFKRTTNWVACLYYDDTRIKSKNILHGPLIIRERTATYKQLYFLMHELGHFIVQQRKDYMTSYPYGYAIINNDSKNTNAIKMSDAHRIDILSEEIEAWNAGRKLADRLGVTFRRNNFDECRVSSLVSHCKWTIKFETFAKSLDP